MVAEKADLRPNTGDQLIEPDGVANPPGTVPVPLEPHTGRRVMNEEDVDLASTAEEVDLVSCVVPLRITVHAKRRIGLPSPMLFGA